MSVHAEQLITNTRAASRGVSKYKTLLIAGIILTVIQQMPIIRDRFYGEIRLALYLLFALVSVKALASIALQKLPRLMKLFMGVIVLLALELLVFQLLNWRSSIFELTELLIPFGIMISAYSLDFEKNETDALTLVYAVLAVLMGVSLVLFYGGGFVLREQYIAGTSKNQTGPILGIASVVVFDRILMIDLNCPHSIRKFAWLTLLLLGAISSLIVVRNRAGLVAVMFAFLIMSISRSRRRPTLVALIIATVIILFLFVLSYLGFLNPLVDIIVKAFTLNYDLRDLDSLSAGRWNIYIQGIEYVQLHPFFGELGASERFFGTPHNYILNKWVRYGLIGSLPFVVFYVYLFVFILITILSRSKKETQSAIWLLLLGLIVSFFEYTYPYGPGVSQVMVWFMLGKFIRDEKSEDR